MADPRFHTVVAFDGAELHVEEDGAADAPVTVVLAHGWTLSARAWRAQAAALAAAGTPAGKVRVLRYDQRGHGFSTPGGAWRDGLSADDATRFGPGPSIDQLGRDLAAVLDQLVPAGPVVLAGHSMGGMTIMALADQRPELFGGKVTGVLLTNTSSGELDRLTLGFPEFVAKPVRISLIKAMRGIAAKPARADAVRARQATDTRLAVAQTRWLLFGRRAPRPLIVECNEIIKSCPSAALAGFFPALMIHDKRTALKALGSAEVEVVAAGRDRLTPLAHARRLAEAIPGARLTILPGTGHMLPMERPRAVTALLTRQVAAAAARAESTA